MIFQCAIALFVLFTTYVMAMNVTVAMIDFLLCAYMGLFILGFSGGSWMRESAMTYLKNLLAKCVKYYATVGIMLFCFDVMQAVLKSVAKSEFSFGVICVILMTFMVICKVMESVPQSISSMIGNAGNTDVASASGIAKAGAMVAGAMAGGVAMKMAGRVGGNLAGMASQKFAGSAMGKALGNKVNAFKQSKTGQMLDKVFGDHSKKDNSAEGKLKQIGEIMSKGNK